MVVENGVKINGVDISMDVLTYRDGKTFTADLTVNGNMKIVEGDSGDGDLNLSSNLMLINETTNDTIISIIPENR